MRPSRHTPSRQRRKTVPGRSRLTVRKAVAALRRGRDALTQIQGQLDALLFSLRDPGADIAADAPERLAGATRQAGRALADLGDMRRLLSNRP